MGKVYVNIENSQMASIGAIFTYIYHTKELNPWPNSSASQGHNKVFTTGQARFNFNPENYIIKCVGG